MQFKSVWQRAFGLERAVVEGVEFDEQVEALVVMARPNARARNRCGLCGRRRPRYDAGRGRRRWRALDMGTLAVFVEADAPRVRCKDHGVVVAQVPWARHGAGHTLAFDAQAAWLAVHVSKSAVTELMRVAWPTVGAIVDRVGVDIESRIDRLDGLTRIGIDEISYKRGHRYLTVVVDHDSGDLVWAAPGNNEATLNQFFDDLGDQRAAQLTHVSADMARWIAKVVAERAPNAVLCADPFHVVSWATDALDVERRRAWNQSSGRRRANPATGRGNRSAGDAKKFKDSRYALWKNPENLTDRQADKLAWIARTDPTLHRAYLLKEGIRFVFKIKGEAGKEALGRWISWARRSRIPAFVDLQRRIVRNRAAIDATLDHGLSNGLIESTNTKIRVLTRVAYGFHSPEPLIALALLALGSHRPELPGRS